MTELKITTESPEMAALIVLVVSELQRAKSKHPEWPDDPMYMDQIVNEEKGEATRAVVQYCMEGGSLSEVKTELIQTAATCLRMLLTIQDYREILIVNNEKAK